jgi:hypothetical protein
MMMNSKRSSAINLTRYAFLVPAVIVLVLIFSVSKAELTKSVIKGNTAIANAINTTIINVAVATENTTVAAKRELLELPKAMSAFITADQEPVKLDTPKKGLTITTNNNEVVVTGYGPAKQNNNEVVVTGYGPAKQNNNEVVVTGYALTKPDVFVDGVLYKPQGVVSRDGGLTFNQQMPSTVQTKGATSNIQIANGVVISSAQTKVTNARINGNVINFTTATDTPKTSRIRLRGNALTITGGEQPLIVVNGKTMRDDEIDNINQDNIESMSVFKGATGIQLYGDKGKNGVIAITLKNTAEAKASGLFGDKLLLIDGVESNQAEVNKLPANKVKNIKMFDAGSAELKKFGDKAKNGAISITTK